MQVYRKRYAHCDPYTIFSGDVFSPSLEAAMLRGSHMIPLLNGMNVDLGCFGNHDFDFGEDRLLELSANTDFPWVLSNATRYQTIDDLIHDSVEGKLRQDALLGGARLYHTAILQGYKVGFFGLAGTDWPSNSRGLAACRILSPVDTARAVARHLRRTEGCDLVIAVTHMRLIEDLDVSEALCDPHDESRVDLVLGGHDHNLLRRYAGGGAAADPAYIETGRANEDVVNNSTGMTENAVGDIRVIKSGTDWRNLSCVKLQMTRNSDGAAKVVGVELEQVADIWQIPHDPSALAENRNVISSWLSSVNARIKSFGSQPLLHSAVSLEGTGPIIRSQETNLCNMLADMVRAFYDVDIAMVNSGSVRCDKLIPSTLAPGSSADVSTALTVRDMIDILPFDNALIVKRVSSDVLLGALENSVSDAHTDGRFLHFSGLKIVADWSLPEGSRVLEVWHHPSSQPGCEPDAPQRVVRGDGREFTTAMTAFIADGFDGYQCFRDQETLVSEEGAMTDTQLLLRMLGYTAGDENVEHHDSSKGNFEEENMRIERARMAVVQDRNVETGLPSVAPMVEGRIKFVGVKGG
ncbi:Metallo-dependent phosphatase-like protein [Annulohypoxylon moriforme]|nr:Metallo-dependent phosphatase-like protein [Annulohypoxylon moriforme]